eukprot:1744577-Rhodomonas_salina.2
MAESIGEGKSCDFGADVWNSGGSRGVWGREGRQGRREHEGSRVRPYPTLLRACYAMPGTELAYAATRVLCDARY